MDKPDPEVLEIMKSRSREGTRWAAYQNQALDSANMGHMQFLHVGEGCTFNEPPEQYPKDTEHGLGWRYRFVGYVNLDTGEISK